MNFIEIILTVCAISNPAVCEDMHLQYASATGSLYQCVMSAQPYIAQWIDQHPKWTAVRWRCDYPGAREKADARGPARAA